jgi:hypothetical protein
MKISALMPEKIHDEHWEQREFVSWFRKNYPGVLIYATPNGGERSISTAARLKVEGVVAGIPDLFVPEWRLFIEMKRTVGGRLSPAQKEIITHLECVGYRVFVAHGCQAAIDFIVENYGPGV